jgi:DNA topoisomerase III
MTVSVLMVAEKPSLARSLAQILSDGASTEHGGSVHTVHSFHGTFRGAPAQFKFVSVAGHLLSLDFTSQYNNWYELCCM